MKYLKVKNKKLIALFFNNELKKLQYKFIFTNTSLPFYIRQDAFKKLKNMNTIGIKYRCYITNNSRSVYNYFKLSRIKLRLLISNNFVNGLKKYNK